MVWSGSLVYHAGSPAELTLGASGSWGMVSYLAGPK